jgi:hypothetical protein
MCVINNMSYNSRTNKSSTTSNQETHLLPYTLSSYKIES